MVADGATAVPWIRWGEAGREAKMGAAGVGMRGLTLTRGLTLKGHGRDPALKGPDRGNGAVFSCAAGAG